MKVNDGSNLATKLTNHMSLKNNDDSQLEGNLHVICFSEKVKVIMLWILPPSKREHTALC